MKADKKVIHLRVKAHDNHGRSYDVTVERGGMSPWKALNPKTNKLEREVMDRWSLHICGTPGTWLMETLLEHQAISPVPSLSIHGRDWRCINFGEVLHEAMITICCDRL